MKNSKNLKKMQCGCANSNKWDFFEQLQPDFEIVYPILEVHM